MKAISSVSSHTVVATGSRDWETQTTVNPCMILTLRQRQTKSRKPLKRESSSFLPITQRYRSAQRKIQLERRRSWRKDVALRRDRGGWNRDNGVQYTWGWWENELPSPWSVAQKTSKGHGVGKKLKEKKRKQKTAWVVVSRNLKRRRDASTQVHHKKKKNKGKYKYNKNVF